MDGLQVMHAVLIAGQLPWINTESTYCRGCGGSITVQLVSCFTDLDSVPLLHRFQITIDLHVWHIPV